MFFKCYIILYPNVLIEKDNIYNQKVIFKKMNKKNKDKKQKKKQKTIIEWFF